VLERREGGLCLARGDHVARAAGVDVLAGTVGDLTDRGGGLAHRLRDLVVADVENLAKDEHGPFRRRKGLQDEHHGHGQALGELGVLGDIRRGEQRLG